MTVYITVYNSIDNCYITVYITVKWEYITVIQHLAVI